MIWHPYDSTGWRSSTFVIGGFQHYYRVKPYSGGWSVRFMAKDLSLCDALSQGFVIEAVSLGYDPIGIGMIPDLIKQKHFPDRFSAMRLCTAHRYYLEGKPVPAGFPMPLVKI